MNSFEIARDWTAHTNIKAEVMLEPQKIRKEDKTMGVAVKGVSNIAYKREDL